MLQARFQSSFFAFTRALDTVTRFARIVATDDWIVRRAREGNMQTLRLWLGA